MASDAGKTPLPDDWRTHATHGGSAAKVSNCAPDPARSMLKEGGNLIPNGLLVPIHLFFSARRKGLVSAGAREGHAGAVYCCTPCGQRDVCDQGRGHGSRALVFGVQGGVTATLRAIARSPNRGIRPQIYMPWAIKRHESGLADADVLFYT